MFFSGFKKHRYAVNAVNAIHILAKMNKEERAEVDLIARNLYVTHGQSITARTQDDIQQAEAVKDRFTSKNMSHFHRLTLYAMAMEASGISPATPHPWDNPKNPFTLNVSMADLLGATSFFERKFGINIGFCFTHIGETNELELRCFSNDFL